jgi:hypothetical protein
MGTDWNQILKEIDCSTVPTVLVKEVVFKYDQEQPLHISMSDIDASSLGPLIKVRSQFKAKVEFVFDIERMSWIINRIVQPMLAAIPSKIQS